MEIDMAEDIETGDQGDSVNFKQLKKQLADATADAAKWKGLFDGARTQIVTSAAQLAGFKPNDEGVFEGIPGLLLEKFQAGLGEDDVPDVGAFSALAKQYGVEATPAAPAVGAAPEGDGAPASDDLAAQLAALSTGDALVGLGQAPKPPADIDERIAAAEKAGDLQGSIFLMQQKAYAGV